MDKELQIELLKILQDTKAFAMEQAPDIVQQYLLWGIVNSIMQILLFILILFLSYKISFKWTNQKVDYEGWSISKVIGTSVSGLAVFLWGMATCISLGQLVKILISPKVYIIEQVSGLL